MTERHGAIDAFEQADPAVRFAPPAPTVDAETYLAELLASDPDVTGNDRTGNDLTGQRPRSVGRVLMAAAAAALMVGWLLTVIGDEPTNRIATDPAWSPAETPPTGDRLGAPAGPIPTEEQRSADDQTDTAWAAITPWVTGDGGRGQYRSNSFRPEVHFIVPDGWTRPVGASEVPTGLAPLTRKGRPAVEGLYLARHKHDASTDDWLARIQDHPSITVGEVEPAVLGGVVGIKVRFDVVGSMTYVDLTEHDYHILEAGQAGVAFVAEIDDEIVSALVLAAVDSDLPAAEAAAQPIIDSIHWRVLCHEP